MVAPNHVNGVEKPINYELSAASANLVQLLPSGTVMAYQALSSSFSNEGKCYASNWYITVVLLVMLSLSCFFSIFTDSFTYKGKLYYGIAMHGRLHVLNMSKKEEELHFLEIREELRNRGLKKRDFVHAVLVVLVFLAMAFTDLKIQNCFFPIAGTDTQQLLKNLPLGIGVFCSAIFLVVPSERKFFGSSDPVAVQPIWPEVAQRVPPNARTTPDHIVVDIVSAPVPPNAPTTPDNIV